MKVKKIVLEVVKPVNVYVDRKTVKLQPKDVVELPVDVAGDLVRAGYAKAKSPFIRNIFQGPSLLQDKER